MRFYGRRLAQSSDGNFQVTGSRSGPDGVIVTSRIIRPQAAPIAVDWRLGISDGFYKIEDFAIDGVSMALAQRSQIRSSPAGAGSSGCCSRRCAAPAEHAGSFGAGVSWRLEQGGASPASCTRPRP